MSAEMLEGTGTEAGVERLGGALSDCTVTISIVRVGEAYSDGGYGKREKGPWLL